MKFIQIICLAVVFSTPAIAAPQWVDNDCWLAAERVTPIHTEPEKEAYVASCIADYTAGTPPPAPDSKNTNRNRY